MNGMTICGEVSTKRRVARHVRSFFIDPTGELWVSADLVPGGPLAVMVLFPGIRAYKIGNKRYPYIQASVLRREYPDRRELMALLDRMAGARPTEPTSSSTGGELRAH
jgi:hypothetical protein